MARNMQCCPKFTRNIKSITKPKNEFVFPERIGTLCDIAVFPSGIIFVGDIVLKMHVFTRNYNYIKTLNKEKLEEKEVWPRHGTCAMAMAPNGLLYVVSGCEGRHIGILEAHEGSPRPIADWQFKDPTAAICHNDLLYVAHEDHQVSVYDQQGQFLHCMGKKGHGDGEFSHPSGIAFSADGLMFVSDCWNHRIQVFTANGKFVRSFGAGTLKYPGGLILTSNNQLLVADRGNNRVVVFSIKGKTAKVVHTFDVPSPCCVAIDKDENILVVQEKRVTVY